MHARRIFASLFLIAGLASPVLGQQLVRVPQDARTLDAAISRVADGGVVELAAGTYPSPGNGFFINNTRKGFTVRAAAGAAVVIDGGGTRNLLRFINSDRARGKRVTFERITFQNGFSADPNESGGVTLSKSEALFRNCSFLNNRAAAPASGGGAVKVLEGSAATFINCSFRNNSSQLRGGAIAIRSAEVTVQGGEFVANRTNLPGHNPNSFGGGIMAIDSTLRVSGVRFEGNEAGWVGGAIYAIGNWNKGSNVFIADSSFIVNEAEADPCCDNPDPSTGGAVHAEDLTTARIHRSFFLLNKADFGGAVDTYRAVVEIHGSVFQGNQPTDSKPDVGAGGAISALSVDFSDASTEFGAINRRPARLLITQSHLQGGPVAQTPHSGGCIFAGGDGLRMFGGGDVPVAGSVEENRADIEIRGTVFFDCNAETAPGINGIGGALVGDLIDLTMEDSMVLDSDASGNLAQGGGIALRQDSNARIVRTTFARNSAQRQGGAIFASGSNLQVEASRFYSNDVAGSFEPLNESRGAAIFSTFSNNPARNATGSVSSSTFAENQGIPVFEIDSQSGLINDMRYNGNRFHSLAFGDRVFFSNILAPGGANVATLNFLARKVQIPNSTLFSPQEGALLAVPSHESAGAGAPARSNSYLAFAWAGGSANINGTALGGKSGFLQVGPGDYTLAVNGAAVATAKALGSCTAGPFLCINGNRFRAEVTFKVGGTTGTGQAAALSGDTGSFWFFDPANVELVVKVLDARTVNGHFWVFFGALTNLEYTLTITDTATGAVKAYFNPAGRFASVGDISAFAAAPGARLAAGASEGLAVPVPAPTAKASCAPGDARLCLSNSRIEVKLNWKDFSGNTGIGHAVPLTGETGYFWFTSQDNVEVIVKVLDARSVNGHFWVFFGALTNVEYTITVTDTETGRTKSYTNPLRTFGSRGDTSAIPAN